MELSGQRIEAGQSVVCTLGAANRDPEIYPDPNRLDITRTGTKPVAFGGGIHFCLGAQLARIEGQIALAALLSRLPDLTLPQLASPDWSPSVFLRGLETLPACYTRRDDHRADLTALAKPAGGAAKARRATAGGVQASRATAGGCPFHHGRGQG